MTPIELWVKDNEPFTRDEIHWLDKLIKFSRERQKEKQSGRAEFHAGQNGVIEVCLRQLNDRMKKS
jgi:hypothetical protein